jgi:hypothetical protein
MSLFNRSPLFGLNLCDALFRGSLCSFSLMAVPVPSSWAALDREGKPDTAVSTSTQGA